MVIDLTLKQVERSQRKLVELLKDYPATEMSAAVMLSTAVRCLRDLGVSRADIDMLIEMLHREETR
jgi:3-oxoacyl-[acyl-carrier-protein] synthase III